jgi:hypothetical protein
MKVENESGEENLIDIESVAKTVAGTSASYNGNGENDGLISAIWRAWLKEKRQ